MIVTGTRTRQIGVTSRMPGGSDTRTHTKDLGMMKFVTAAMTFVASPTGQIQAANGTFAPFALDDVLLIEGANLNNGLFVVLALDTVNHAFLTLDPPPKAEGPITLTVRTG